MSGNKHAHIIGIGSPSGDDQAGWLVVEALENRLPPEVRVEKLDRPGSALIPHLEKADRVILIDAMQGRGLPGEIHHYANDEWAGYRNGLSSHGLGVFEALMLAKELDCLPEKLDLYGIEISSVLPGNPPCEAVIMAAEKLADSILQTTGTGSLITKAIQTTPPGLCEDSADNKQGRRPGSSNRRQDN